MRYGRSDTDFATGKLTLNTGDLMHPREEILGLAAMYRERGEPYPVDLLARAEALGIYLTEFDRPSIKTKQKKGDVHGTTKETDF